MTARRRTRGRAVRAGAALLAAGLLAGCGLLGTEPEPDATTDGRPRDASPSPSSELKDTPKSPALPAALTSQRPDWKRCTAPPNGRAPGSGWRCTSVQVPLDYRKPSGETISIALIRKEARDKDRRIGSLLFNFGGPGGSGVDILPRAAGAYGKLNSRYDLVGFDRAGSRPAPGCAAAPTRSRSGPSARWT